MPINSVHPAYQASFERWKRCRDAYDGEDAIKAGGTQYLPRVDPSQTAGEYSAYKARALYYEAVSRTVNGFVGAIARKPNSIVLPEKMQGFASDVTAEGLGLDEFIKRLCMETILLGRGGVLVDYDDALGRAYLAVYTAESITNWADGLIVLHETVFEADPADRFAQKAVEQYRELALVDGRYTVTLWRQGQTQEGQTRDSGDWAIYGKPRTPTRRGQPLDTIPFFWFSAMGRTERISNPPLLGLVNTVLSHYRSSADLEHGRHFTGMPTLYVTGLASDEPISIGAATAIILSDPAAKVGFAEFTGQGLQSLETALATKEHQMATLGAAILGWGRKGVEAAETARIRTSGETSLLMGVISAVEDTIEAALACAAAWMNAAGPVRVAINRDLIDTPLDPAMLTALLASLQAGSLSMESFLFALQQADLLPPETDIGQEAGMLKAARR